MTGTVKLDAATLDGFAAEFTKHYEAKEYAEAYPYGIVIFEANAAMRNWMKDAHYTHERVAWEKVTRRMHHVFCDKAGVPAWNFYLPIEPSP